MSSADRHKSAVASLGCVVCRNEGHGESPAAIHHIREGQGMAQRATDFEVIPLCPTHHQTGGYGVALHAGQETFEEKYGTEGQLLMETYLTLEQVNERCVTRLLCDCRYCRGEWKALVGLKETCCD